MTADDPHSEKPQRDEQATWLDRVAEAEVRFLQYLEKWRLRFRTHPQTGLPLAPLRQSDYDDALSLERLAFRTGRGLTIALQVFAPICFTIFLLSFLWDPWGFFRSCSIAGLIGFGTNWIAIKMLFWPRESRPIFGQGLIPSQRDEIIDKVANEVIEKLINERIIKQEIEESRLISRLTAETVREIRHLVRDPEFVADTKQLILTYAAKVARSDPVRDELLLTVEERVEQFFGSSFASWLLGRLRGLLSDPLVRIVDRELDDLPETLDRLVGEVDEALDHIPAFLEQRQDTIERALTRIVMSLIREMDVRAIILKQLSTVTSEQLEAGFREFADDKLSYITIVGGILGAIGGFVIIWPFESVLVLLGLGTALMLADVGVVFVSRRLARGRRAEEPPPEDCSKRPR